MDVPDDAEVVCVYGKEPFAVYEELKGWLFEKEGRSLVCLVEENQAAFLLYPLPRMRCVVGGEEAFRQIAWEFLFLRVSYSNFSGEKRGEELFALLEHYREGAHLVASDYRDFGAQVLKNTFSNFARAGGIKKGENLAGVFSQVPALVCGAGPSFFCTKGMATRALIFAGGSALNTLQERGVEPHCIAALDPAPPPSRFRGHVFHEAPFFFQSRVCAEVFSLAHGEKFWLSPSGGYPLEEWMAEELGLKSPPFEGGWNVATFCAALGQQMGCSPIIFVGMDLCTSSENLYASGVEEKKGEGLVEVKNRLGETVFARRDWLMAAKWLEGFVKQHPETLFLSADARGLSIEGVEYMPLEEVAQKYCSKQQDISGKVHAALTTLAPFPLDPKTVEECAKEVEESRQRCAEKCVCLLSLLEKHYPHLPSDRGGGGPF